MKIMEGNKAMTTVSVDIMKEVTCYDRRKSFYGKCFAKEHIERTFENGACVAVNLANVTLYSYNTPICTLYFCGNGNNYLVRLWEGYSVTTMRHIDSFLKQYGFYKYGGKAWWDSIRTNEKILL